MYEIFQCKKRCNSDLKDIDKSFYGLVLEVKNVSIIVSAKYLDYINIMGSMIILLIWSSKSPIGALNIVHL